MANAQTFLSFMSAYAIFMAPLASLLLADYWIVKKRRYDVPALYDPDGIYGKCNWRSLIILMGVIIPLMPGLAQRVTPDNVTIPNGMRNLFAINYMYGFISAMVLYLLFNWIWPDRKTLIPYTVHGTPVRGVDVDAESGKMGGAGAGVDTASNSAAAEELDDEKTTTTTTKEPKTQTTAV